MTFKELQQLVEEQGNKITELEEKLEEKEDLTLAEKVDEIDQLIKNHKHTGDDTSLLYEGIATIDTTGVGTVATNGTTTLTGTGTKFSIFNVGDTIKVHGETNRTIAEIASNTSLTVSVAFSTTASGLSYGLWSPPSGTPSKRLTKQIIIYVSGVIKRLYIYDFTAGAWYYVALSA